VPLNYGKYINYEPVGESNQIITLRCRGVVGEVSKWQLVFDCCCSGEWQLADVVFGCGGCKLLAAESVLCIGDKIASFLAVTMRKAIRESSV